MDSVTLDVKIKKFKIDYCGKGLCWLQEESFNFSLGLKALNRLSRSCLWQQFGSKSITYPWSYVVEKYYNK